MGLGSREVSMEGTTVGTGMGMNVRVAFGSIVDTGDGSWVGAGGCVGIGMNVSTGVGSGDGNGDGCSVD